MSLGILTFYDSNNFGAVLQAYALQRIVDELHGSSEIIKFERKSSQTVVQNQHASRQHLWERIIWRFLRMRYQHDVDTQKTCFQTFRSDYLRLGSYVYRTEKELWAKVPSYDAYICGSDQIWNPFHSKYIQTFMLGFVPENRRRISYAASFGVNDVSGWIPSFNVANELRRFDNISVREKSGVKIVKELSGRDAVQVLDPTFLLKRDDWSRLCGESALSEPYILVYSLAPLTSNIRQTLKEMQRKLKSRIVILPFSKDNVRNFYLKRFSIGPIEFLSLIKNAKCVVTNSFHGLAFSVIFNRPFWVFIGESMVFKQRAGRITEFLELIGLSDRLLPNHTSHIIEQQYIDYESVNIRLENEYKASMCFLHDAL